jgi:hypothetical protein
VIPAAVIVSASVLASVVPAGAGADRPPLALSASPTRVVLAAGSWTPVRVTNAGRAPVVVDVATGGFALDLRGRPRIVSGGRGAVAAGWLAVEPRRLTLAAGRAASVTVSAVVPRSASPGEHAALVLLRTRPQADAPVPIVMQVGVVVVVRVRGRIVHRLDVRGLRLVRHGARRTLVLTLWNRGNVSEMLGARRVRVVLRRGRRLLATFMPARRELLPHSIGTMTLRYAGRARGWVQASVVLHRPRPGTAVVRRTFRIRL